MTAWLLSFGWNWLLVPVLIWFLRGLFNALRLPRVKYLSHSKTGRGYLLTVRRQERLPPFRLLNETWLLNDTGSPHYKHACREGDGYGCHTGDDGTLAKYLYGTLAVALARDAETEELSK